MNIFHLIAFDYNNSYQSLIVFIAFLFGRLSQIDYEHIEYTYPSIPNGWRFHWFLAVKNPGFTFFFP